MRKISYPSLLLAAIFFAAFNTVRAEDVDVSSTYFQNLDFESCTSDSEEASNMPGWTVDHYFDSNGGPWVKTVNSSYAMEIYKASGTSVEAQLLFHQTSSGTLSPGVYTVSVEAHANVANVVALYARVGDNTAQTALLTSASSNWNSTTTYKIEGIEISTASTLTIGISIPQSTTSELNMYFDNFKVVCTESYDGGDDGGDDGGNAWSSSDYFQNLDFESSNPNAGDISTACPGWTVDHSLTGTNASGPWPSENDGYMSASCESYVMKIYKPSGTSVSQEILFHQDSKTSLPAGVYTVSVEAHANVANVVALYAKVGDTTYTANLSSSSNTWGTTATYTITDIEISEASTLTIGIQISQSTTSELNMYFDNFTVTQTEAYEDETDDGFTDDYDGTWDDVSDYFTNLDFESSTVGTDDNGHSYVSNCDPWDTSNYSYFCAKWTSKDKIRTETPWPVIKSDADALGTASSGVSGKYMYVYSGYSEDADGKPASELSSVPANTYVFFQTSSQKVPAGTYTVSAVVHADGTDAFALYAIGTNEVTEAIMSTSTYSDAERYFVTLTLTKSVYLEIGIKTTAEITTEANLYADDFKVVLDEAYDAGSIAAGEDVWMESTDLYGFKNLDFETYTTDEDETTLTGWTAPNYSADKETYTLFRTTKDDYMSDYVDGHVFESWIPSTYLDKVNGDFLYQTVTVPAGYYIISAAVHCDHDGIYLFASDGTTDFATASCPIGNEWKNAKLVTISFRLTAETSLKFGLRSTIAAGTSLNDNQLNVYADNFEIYDERCVAQVTDAGYATYFSNHKYHLPEGLTGATITGYSTAEGVNGVTGTLTQNWKYSGNDEEKNEVPHRTALLLKGDENTYYGHITEEGDDETDYTEGEMNPEDTDNMLRGTAESDVTTTGPDGETTGYKFYMLSYGDTGTGYEDVLGFYWGADDGVAFTSEAHKAWLPIKDDGSGSTTKLIGFTLDGGDDNTTGITAVTPAATTGDAIYNLQGVRLNDTSKKGVYIIGGRKTIVK